MKKHPDEAPESEGIRLIIGLGNPGKDYEHTRHNVGFDTLDILARKLNLDWEKDRRSQSLVARRGTSLILAKPQTFMNRSGETAAALARFFRVPAGDILVVYDDVDTDLGKIKFKTRGSSGGHNGIKSLIQHLGTEDFPRLKIGIGGGGGKSRMIGHVLGKFREEERSEIENALAEAADSVEYALANGLGSAMNHYNRREKPKKETNPNPEENPET